MLLVLSKCLITQKNPYFIIESHIVSALAVATTAVIGKSKDRSLAFLKSDWNEWRMVKYSIQL